MNSSITHALALLTAGKPICFPTETVYALAADACCDQAIETIYRLKGRRQNHPLALMVATEDMANQYVQFSSTARQLAKTFWPGPLTLIMPLKKNAPPLSPLLNAGLSTLAIRVPDHSIAQTILREWQKPLVATSVNPTGKPSATNSDAIYHYFQDQLFVITEHENSAQGIASTIVDMTHNSMQLIRQGVITQAMLESSLSHPL